MVHILLGARDHGLEAICAACAEALETGSCNADLILNIAARAASLHRRRRFQYRRGWSSPTRRPPTRHAMTGCLPEGGPMKRSELMVLMASWDCAA